MDELKLDAFVYPTWNFPPQIVGQTSQQSAGDNSQQFSPTSGFPAINVPMGFSRDNTLPAGMTIFGRAWAEATLIKGGLLLRAGYSSSASAAAQVGQ